MKTIDKNQALILHLNKLTLSNAIEWGVDDPPRTIVTGSDDHIKLFLTTKVKEQDFGLYLANERIYDGETDEFYWGERLHLILLDSDDRVLWEFRELSAALWDLFNSARRKASNIDSIIDSILGEGPGAV
jgi:hypothetical protein